MLKFLYNYHEKKREFARKEVTLFTIFSLAMILFWVFTFKSVILDANNIPSGSMIPTLKIGDFLFVNKMRYSFKIPYTDIVIFKYDSPRRGDIITFTPPPIPSLVDKILVKRVIGLPGDVVEVVDNEIYINGVHYPVSEAADRSILDDIDYPSYHSNISKEHLELYFEEVIDPESGEVMRRHYMMKEDPERRRRLFTRIRNPEESWSVPEGHYMVMGDNRDNSEDSRSWGFVPEENIQGKVFMVYFSVNWNSRMDAYGGDEGNPFMNLLRLVRGDIQDAYVRWSRIGERVY